ncbi:MAG: serine/threonine protein kinase [Labilithrix sp.]|nr:serine/threonine protein kinase [Labilithrix sp.]
MVQSISRGRNVLTKLLAKDGEGERLDRFELIAELASGGMATVFLARLSGVAGFQRLVAIKRLHPHLAREPEFVEMFLDEARLAARIHHPNVVPIQEVGESDSGYYLVMDYIEGDTLARVLAKAAKSSSTVPYGVTIRVLLDVLAGLHAAHEMKDDHGEPLHIVHRDVSPQNILVGVDGVARVVDFGVARAASRLSTTRSGQLKGKLAYMAPEQARGAPVDRRADLFACGIVLWEALATKRLFKGDGEAETLNRVLYDPIAPPSSVRSDVPIALEAVCMKALSRDVDQRYANAQEFGDALEKAARALDSVGSVRDVAQCLQEVIGTDLTQQREAVRAWLARSEPSDSAARTGPRSKPVLDSIVTRVDGGSEPSASRREGSSASRRGSMPARDEAADAARLRSHRPSPLVDRGAVTGAAPVEGVSAGPASAPPEKVSSVSSAVIQVPASGPVSTGAPAPSRARTGGRIAIALVAAVVLVGVGAWGAKSLGGREGAAAGAGTAATAATAPATTATVPSAAGSGSATVTATATATASPEASTVASAAASATSTSTSTRPTRPSVRPAASARPNGKPAGVPDELNNNPYR